MASKQFQKWLLVGLVCGVGFVGCVGDVWAQTVGDRTEGTPAAPAPLPSIDPRRMPALIARMPEPRRTEFGQLVACVSEVYDFEAIESHLGFIFDSALNRINLLVADGFREWDDAGNLQESLCGSWGGIRLLNNVNLPDLLPYQRRDEFGHTFLQLPQLCFRVDRSRRIEGQGYDFDVNSNQFRISTSLLEQLDEASQERLQRFIALPVVQVALRRRSYRDRDRFPEFEAAVERQLVDGSPQACRRFAEEMGQDAFVAALQREEGVVYQYFLNRRFTAQELQSLRSEITNNPYDATVQSVAYWAARLPTVDLSGLQTVGPPAQLIAESRRLATQARQNAPRPTTNLNAETACDERVSVLNRQYQAWVMALVRRVFIEGYPRLRNQILEIPTEAILAPGSAGIAIQEPDTIMRRILAVVQSFIEEYGEGEQTLGNRCFGDGFLGPRSTSPILSGNDHSVLLRVAVANIEYEVLRRLLCPRGATRFFEASTQTFQCRNPDGVIVGANHSLRGVDGEPNYHWLPGVLNPLLNRFLPSSLAQQLTAPWVAAAQSVLGAPPRDVHGETGSAPEQLRTYFRDLWQNLLNEGFDRPSAYQQALADGGSFTPFNIEQFVNRMFSDRGPPLPRLVFSARGACSSGPSPRR